MCESTDALELSSPVSFPPIENSFSLIKIFKELIHRRLARLYKISSPPPFHSLSLSLPHLHFPRHRHEISRLLAQPFGLRIWWTRRPGTLEQTRDRLLFWLTKPTKHVNTVRPSGDNYPSPGASSSHYANQMPEIPTTPWIPPENFHHPQYQPHIYGTAGYSPIQGLNNGIATLSLQHYDCLSNDITDPDPHQHSTSLPEHGYSGGLQVDQSYFTAGNVSLPFRQQQGEYLFSPSNSAVASASGSQQEGTTSQEDAQPTAVPYRPSPSSLLTPRPMTNRPHHVRRRARLRCTFPGCTSPARFARNADRDRHMSCVHFRHTLKLQECPVSSCRRKGDRGFKRKDHLTEHLRSIHHMNIPRRTSRTAANGKNNGKNSGKNDEDDDNPN